MKRGLRSMLLGVLVAVFPLAGQAVIVNIDQFGIDKNGANFFTDNFSNGTTPSQESRYSVFGSFPNGAEAGGLLTLNSAWGGVSPNALGQLRQSLATTYLSPLSAAGLTVRDTIDVFGLFSLVIPVGPLNNSYGVQVRNSTNDRQAELYVQYNPNLGGNVIRFLGSDFTNGTIATLGFVALAPPDWADQVALDIFKPDANSQNFFGAYAFCRSGVCNDGDFTVFDAPFALFGTTDYVRGRFLAFSAVPEPATLGLLGLALAGLAALRRRTR